MENITPASGLIIKSMALEFGNLFKEMYIWATGSKEKFRGMEFT